MDTQMAVNTMDRETAKLVGDELRAAVQTVAAKYGLRISGKMNGKYDPMEGIYRTTIELQTQAGAAATAEMEGFPSDIIGKTFVNMNIEYRITGINPKSQAHPVQVERVSDGRRFSFARGVADRAK